MSLREGSGLWAELISEAALSSYSFLADGTNKIQESDYSQSLHSAPRARGKR